MLKPLNKRKLLCRLNSLEFLLSHPDTHSLKLVLGLLCFAKLLLWPLRIQHSLNLPILLSAKFHIPSVFILVSIKFWESRGIVVGIGDLIGTREIFLSCQLFWFISHKLYIYNNFVLIPKNNFLKKFYHHTIVTTTTSCIGELQMWIITFTIAFYFLHRSWSANLELWYKSAQIVFFFFLFWRKHRKLFIRKRETFCQVLQNC